MSADRRQCGDPTVQRVFALQVLGLPTPHPVSVAMTWWRGDPWAVELSFESSEVRWLVARDLLAAGVTRPAGLGDVAVLPDLSDDFHVELILSSPDGRIGLRASTHELAEFLRQTWRHVPSGEERPDIPRAIGDGEPAW